MTPECYMELRTAVIEAGYGREVEWAQNVELCVNSGVFFQEYAWVVINSGMKNQVAERIWERVKTAIGNGQPVQSAFGHPGKAEAIQTMLRDRCEVMAKYRKAKDKLAFLQGLPWIGPITKYHLAKNLGLDYAKPDRHLERIAKTYGTTVYGLCASLAWETGHRIGAVDQVLWRAANLGML